MPKLLEQVRIVIRTRHYSLGTEQAYICSYVALQFIFRSSASSAIIRIIHRHRSYSSHFCLLSFSVKVLIPLRLGLTMANGWKARVRLTIHRGCGFSRDQPLR